MERQTGVFAAVPCLRRLCIITAKTPTGCSLSMRRVPPSGRERTRGDGSRRRVTGETERERVNLCQCLGEIIVESAHSSLVYRQ